MQLLPRVFNTEITQARHIGDAPSDALPGAFKEKTEIHPM
jgi:hypothetical protein